MSGGVVFWTEEMCLGQIRAWAEKHGRPPTVLDWRCGGYNRPSWKPVVRIFGSGSAGIRAAGFEPHRSGFGPWWTEERIVEAQLDWLMKHGRWPSKRDWSHVDETRSYPSLRQVQRIFGTLGAARRAAGWSARCQSCSERLPRKARPTQKFCSQVCRTAGRRVRARVPGPRLCVGCSADLDSFSSGCRHCNDRRRRRNRRAAVSSVAVSAPVETTPLASPVEPYGETAAVPFITETDATASRRKAA